MAWLAGGLPGRFMQKAGSWSAGDERMTKSQLSELVSMKDPAAVRTEVLYLARLVAPGLPDVALARTWDDVCRLYRGEYRGYRACATGYHDRFHMMDVTLATMRLLHGAAVDGMRISPMDAANVFLAALFHDVGYIQSKTETEGTGARFTSTHVARGIEFMKTYLAAHPVSPSDAETVATLMRFTDLGDPVERIAGDSTPESVLGRIVAAGDLLGQMADRTYLEKLPALYEEFRESGNTQFDSAFSLLKNSLQFNILMQERLTRDLGSVDFYMQTHFRARWGIDEDLYAEAIARNMSYLSDVVRHHPDDWAEYLKRSLPDE